MKAKKWMQQTYQRQSKLKSKHEPNFGKWKRGPSQAPFFVVNEARITKDRTMLLFAGLGNPGSKYAKNRHNIGFMVLDEIASDHGFSPWKSQFQGEVASGNLGGEKVLLLKPSTFMNLSGQAAPGKVRVKMSGGHAGHNGLRSIHQHIGEHYQRVRLGIGHPGHKDRVSHYVLSDFAKAEAGWLDDVTRGCADGAPELAKGDPARFMNAVALRTAPARSSKTPAPKTTPKPAPKAQPEVDTRSALQKLADKFRS